MFIFNNPNPNQRNLMIYHHWFKSPSLLLEIFLSYISIALLYKLTLLNTPYAKNSLISMRGLTMASSVLVLNEQICPG